ncbi:hypothetical protein ABPG74_022823 [Tetrahymena malaccensis]
MNSNSQKLDYEQRLAQHQQPKSRLTQLYKGGSNQQIDSTNHYQNQQYNNNNMYGSSQNKFISQLYSKGLPENDFSKKQSKLDMSKKDSSKIIVGQSSMLGNSADFIFKTPPDQFTKKKFVISNKQASVQIIKPEYNLSHGADPHSFAYNNVSGSLQRQDLKKNPQQINYGSDKRKQSLNQNFSGYPNQNKENDTQNQNDVRLPKLDSYPNSPPIYRMAQKIEESQSTQKIKKMNGGDQDNFKLSVNKERRSSQAQSNSTSINDFDSTATSPQLVAYQKSPQLQQSLGNKNFYLQKDNSENLADSSSEQLQNNTSSPNSLNGQSPKTVVGHSPRYNIIKYKQNQNQSKINSQQQYDQKKTDDYPNQLIRPLIQSPDISDSSINSSLINNSSDLVQIKKFEKKLKLIKESNELPSYKEKKQNEFQIPQREVNSSLASYQQQIIQQMSSSTQRKNQLNNNLQTNKLSASKPLTQVAKFKYPQMNSILKTKAGQYSQFIRKQNQDAGLLQLNFMGDKHCSLSGVFDGHGEYGTQVSNFVKKGIQKHLMKEIKQNGGLEGENLDIPSCFRRAYQQTNKELLGQNQFDVQMSGCTAVSVLQYRNELYCANTGDSRAIVIRQTSNNEWRQVELSKDHKPEVPEEKARINANGGRVEQSVNEDGEKAGIYRVWKKNMDLPGLAMSRSMGDSVGRECGVICDPDIIQHTLTEEDKMIIIASDGVWEFLSNVDVTKIITPYFRDGKISEGVDRIISISHKEWLKEGDSVDDITCVAFFIQGIKEGYEENK